MLNPSDILDGAAAPADAGVFVIGTFDSRITFYSQQVRGLELAYALKDQGRLRQGMRCAVVGAGAAGVAAASALVLLEELHVALFDTANEVLSLQSASDRRRLDPHIFDWPGHNTPDPIAGLPILDWRAGAARMVRGEVKTEFDAIVGKTGGRLDVRTRHRVTSGKRQGRALQLTFEQHPAVGPAEVKTETFDLVILAFGFGMEEPGAAYASLPSYWEDGGMPGLEFTGRPQPRFLVSGDGDGALIDLVAAASANFRHSEMLALVTAHPGVDRIVPAMEAVDDEGREAFRQGQPFDYRAAYDLRVYPDLEQLGLVNRFAAGLRPGVHVTLQTLAPEPFHARTATLNRLAAYLVAKVCGDRFVHLCGPLTPIATPAPEPYAARHWFECDGVQLGVDTAIIRHGPDRAGVRAPFAGFLNGFEAAHDAWVERHSARTVRPVLSVAARSALSLAAQKAELPQACWRIADLAGAMPIHIAVQTNAGAVTWSGDLAIGEAATLWDGASRRVTVYVPPMPAEMPAMAGAVLRLAVHSPQVEMKGDVGLWRTFAESRTSRSAHGKNFRIPPLSAGVPEGVGQHPETAADAQLAQRLNRVLDRWILDTVDAGLARYIDTGVDEGSVITLRAHETLRAAMGPIWVEWRGRFQAEPDLLDRFLRLTVCAPDTEESAAEARVLVGPQKQADILRATAVALMIAAGWTQVSPAGAVPGNLALTRPNGGWTGHACGADLIDRQPLALQAARFLWRTNFVVLPLTDSSVSVTFDAEASFSSTPDAALTLATVSQPNFILTTDPAFRQAAKASLDALAAHLAAAEGTHFAKQRDAVEEVQP